ncbi:UNVERIFIED_CONTAM: hypothetical protein RMT77_005589 [Armadillidium vulgare]
MHISENSSAVEGRIFNSGGGGGGGGGVGDAQSISLQLPQTRLDVPYAEGLIGGGIISAGLFITVFTLVHAILSTEHDRRKRNIGEDNVLKEGMSIPDNISEENKIFSQDESTQSRFKEKDSSEISTLILKDLKNIFPLSNKDMIKIKKEMDRKTFHKNLKTFSEKEFDEEILKKVEKGVGQDFEVYLDSVFSSLPPAECYRMESICFMASEAGEELSQMERESLRNFRLLSLNDIPKKDMFFRKVLAVSTLLLYASDETCKKISKRCFRLSFNTYKGFY